jgi:hypothetical protein
MLHYIVHRRQTRRARAATAPHVATGLASEQNVEDLAAVIWTEARGIGQLAMTAVGSTVLNRMRRNGTTSVRSAWQGYQHNHPPDAATLNLARRLLQGQVTDPTAGATHFYTPNIMPQQGQPTAGHDVGGDLEQVPGMVDSRGAPVQNYRPGWVKTFMPRPVPGIPERYFRFYEQPRNTGRVR